MLNYKHKWIVRVSSSKRHGLQKWCQAWNQTHQTWKGILAWMCALARKKKAGLRRNQKRIKRERQTLTFTHPASIGLLSRLHSDKEALGDQPWGGGSEGAMGVCVDVKCLWRVREGLLDSRIPENWWRMREEINL